jgi:P27 family predicted phage terminase small subunit
MMRGRKPRSPEVNEQEGAFVNNPNRRNENAPKPQKGRPEPSDLVLGDLVALRKWNDLCDNLEAMNVLSVADGALLELYCMSHSLLTAHWEEIKGGNIESMDDHGRTGTKPAAKDFNTQANRMVKILAELGLTPSARSRVVAQKDGEDDPFEEWMKGMVG